MATINERQRINVAQEHVQARFDKSILPNKRGAKSNTKFLVPQKNEPKSSKSRKPCKYPISHPKIEKRPWENPKREKPDRPLIDQPNGTSKTMKSIRNEAKKSTKHATHGNHPDTPILVYKFTFGPNSKPQPMGNPQCLRHLGRGQASFTSASTTVWVASTCLASSNSAVYTSHHPDRPPQQLPCNCLQLLGW